MNLELLISHLRCPRSRSTLSRLPEGLGSDSGVVYPIIDGVPVFTYAGASIQKHPSSHLSNVLAPDALKLIAETPGLVLNLSAGGSATKPSNVVELEYSIFRNTTVVGDAHQLPFADETFAGCLCMNAFEHYHSPHVVANEVLRVLKPGGWFFMHTAGLQPLHEAPHHYYNATQFGVARWLSRFQEVDICISPNFNPIFGLSWILAALHHGVIASGRADQAAMFERATLKDIMQFWTDAATRTGHLWQLFQDLDMNSQAACASGWQAKAMKPLRRNASA